MAALMPPRVCRDVGGRIKSNKPVYANQYPMQMRRDVGGHPGKPNRNNCCKAQMPQMRRAMASYRAANRPDKIRVCASRGFGLHRLTFTGGMAAKDDAMMFTYHINLAERGDFYADVRDPSGATVYDIHADTLAELVEDGFMRHGRDVAMLADHLRDIGIIPPGGFLRMA